MQETSAVSLSLQGTLGNRDSLDPVLPQGDRFTVRARTSDFNLNR